ncbi:hypothetical protein EON69_00340 [bacterium]|nr:MAG: hypothetical protein EON69_00340 [bacterium]
MKPVALTGNKPFNRLYCIISTNFTIKNKRAYSSFHLLNSKSQQKEHFTIDSLDDFSVIYSNRTNLLRKTNVYCFLNKISNKKYIGSAKNLYLRLTEHFSGT